MDNTNILETLANDFSKQDRKKVRIDGIETDLFILPCTFEDSSKLASIQSLTDAKKRATAIARFIIPRVELEDRTKAFKSCLNKTAVEVLSTLVKPSIVQEIFLEVCKTALSEEALEDIEGKQEQQD